MVLIPIEEFAVSPDVIGLGSIYEVLKVAGYVVSKHGGAGASTVIVISVSSAKAAVETAVSAKTIATDKALIFFKVLISLLPQCAPRGAEAKSGIARYQLSCRDFPMDLWSFRPKSP
jgi:hypothetical protein